MTPLLLELKHLSRFEYIENVNSTIQAKQGGNTFRLAPGRRIMATGSPSEQIQQAFSGGYKELIWAALIV